MHFDCAFCLEGHHKTSMTRDAKQTLIAKSYSRAS
jgi:hypothetical protein